MTVKKQENQSTMLSSRRKEEEETTERAFSVVRGMVSLECQGGFRKFSLVRVASSMSLQLMDTPHTYLFIGSACRSGFWREFAVTSHEESISQS
jgi:hypothetical protein